MIAFVFAAVMTPTPDAMTMLAVALPICGLYFVALGVCVLHDRRVDRQRVAAGLPAPRRDDGRRARRRRGDRVIHLGVVVNPTAGKGRGTQAGRRVHELLRARGHKVEDLSAATLAQATDRARAAAVQGLDALVVVGGDGMVHLGVNVVAGTGLPLGIVAAGTGNDIARTLALPRGDVEASVAAIEHGLLDGPRRVDAVRVGLAGARRARVVPRRAVLRVRRRDQRARQRDDLAQGVRPLRPRARRASSAGSARTATA